MAVDANPADRLIYEQELRSFLPEKIFDAHVHLFEESSIPPDYQFPPKSCFRKFGGRFRMEDYRDNVEALLPDQTVYLNHFGFPEAEFDRDNAAIYTGTASDNRRSYGMAIVSPRDGIAEVVNRIARNRLIGYKPYAGLVDGVPSEDITIADMLTPEQMGYANENGLAVTLHIPRDGRLADPVNQRDMVEICRRYPHAQIVFAHIGRAYYLRSVIGFLDGIARCPNAFIDTAMVNHEGVLEYAFRNFPRERILWGSDAPVAFLRGKSVEINNQYAYLMGEDYQIGTSLFDANGTVEFTFFLYEQLRGVKSAAAGVGLSRLEIENIFFGNACRLFSSIAKNLNYTQGVET